MTLTALPGPAELRRLRHTRGRSQERLADESGISVRALRNIESGHTRPHRSTLVRLAEATDLTERARAAFVELWYPAGRPAAVADDRLGVHARRALRRLRYVQRTCHTFVGRERAVDRCRATVAVRALDDGPDRAPVVTHGPCAPDRDQDRFRLSELRNCAAGRTLFVPAARATVTELLFDQPLVAGEQYWCGCTTDYAAAREPGLPTSPSTGTRVGVLNAGTDVTLGVTFDLACAPESVWYAYSPCGSAGTEPVRALRLSRFHSVSVTVRAADPGIHEIAWAWP